MNETWQGWGVYLGQQLQALGLGFVWPHWLWLLLTLPMLVLAYAWLLGRARREALVYPQLALVRQAMQGRSQWQRHVPAVLMLLALACMLLALARPTGRIALPTNQQTVILAIDLSISMRATDVKPSRLQAAQAAARTFIDRLPNDVKVGVVTFAGTAHVAQMPTTDRTALHKAIDGFQLQRATATGNAIVVSLSSLLPEAGIELAQLGLSDLREENGPREQPLPEQHPFSPQLPGSFNSGAIVMLSDGQRTVGLDALEAAQMAADRGVRVYTVGVGTVNGEVIGFDGWSMRVRLDEAMLREVASLTHAQYFHATSAEDLTQVYQSLSQRFGVEVQHIELGALLSGLAALLTLLGLGSSLWRNRRIL